MCLTAWCPKPLDCAGLRHVRLRSPREKQTPPPPSAAAVTPTQVCCRHFFSVFGASATCWHPGLRALGSFCAPLNARCPHPDSILGHPWGRRSSPARPVCPVCPPASSQARLCSCLLPLNRVRMLPPSQAPSLVRSPGLPRFSQPPDSRLGAENQHTRNNLGFQLWALHAEPRPRPPAASEQGYTPPLPCSSALQPSPETWEQEPGASICPTAPQQGHYRALGQGPLICPLEDKKGQESRSPKVAQHGWSFLPSSVRGADSIPKGLWLRGKEEPSRGLRVTLGSPRSGCPH